ncbi:hypothetical protein [Actinoplanes xinjiangensis]|uniref:Uncharacterized protein n=1 Tax=Actinoplanes xinjiangensis TaxID=512350 RepID=A0A316EQJ5_9ACTN|nr:hypothetical protein [Actinoplanes xinjiangensis]PWK33263.1 hypothetical protein BC793_12853 [Actinoplanes xinjiangensis]GIF43498.1 hypothetical protein Axi01nite_78090 [Actinoplanes xinjiangensis]
MSRKTGKPSWIKAGPRAATTSQMPGKALRAAVALLTAAAVGLFIGVQVASPSATDAAITSLRADEAKREAAQIVELTALARSTSQQIKPVVDGLQSGLPATDTGAAATRPVTAEQLAQWKQIMAQQVERHKGTPSGSTASNVARNGLRNAVNQLAVALDTAAAAHALPTDRQAPLLAVASRQRLLAVNVWSVTATQLDQLNIDAGNGHQHVYLTDTPEGGATIGDESPEGR